MPRRRRIPRLFQGTSREEPVPAHTHSPPPPRPRRWGVILLSLAATLTLLLGGLTGWLLLREMRSSELQARYLVPIASELTWEVGVGPSPDILFPGQGPYDLRLGYTSLPAMIESAQRAGFQVSAQARVSPEFRRVVEEWELFPIYKPKVQAGLELLDRSAELFHNGLLPERIYPTFETIPPILWQTLLFVENRSILDPDYPMRNPAVEWPRLLASTFELGLRRLGREGNVSGASTLATQLEKFRFSPLGVTATPADKLRQMASASLRAYLDGAETLSNRREIVRDYLNSVPLAAQRGEGEVIGIGDGLFAWFARDFGEANRILGTLDEGPAGEGEWPDPEAGVVYREVLSLILSQRRPTWYLTDRTGREELARLTDRYLRLLEGEGIIPSELTRAALATEAEVRTIPPPRPPISFVARKGANAVRTQLLTTLSLPTLYDLDRLDLRVRSTLDAPAQRAVSSFLASLSDRGVVARHGLDAPRLLDRGNPASVIYSLVLHEIGDGANLVRIQTDNVDAPFNLNESARLELGSTAKLRTLASYLEAIAELHTSYRALTLDALEALPISRNDPLGQWVRSELLADPGLELITLLRRAMERRYSASPQETFVTGGGIQSFTNFDNTYDRSVLPVSEAFQQSVNLVFVRMMRDVVNYLIYRVPGSTAHVLDAPDSPLRQEYLARFADREGIEFLDRFIPKFRGEARGEILTSLVEDRRLTPQRIAWVYRSVVADPALPEFEALLRAHQPDAALSPAAVQDLYNRANPTNQTLADLGYLSSVHPLELWAARYLIEHPAATRSEMIQASVQVRQDVYRWLFQTSRQGAQDQRIRFLLEVEAFTAILAGWRELGYPFENIVPSLGSSIGSSGDRPSALGELVGIILNGGVRQPTVRIEELHFAAGTPYETQMVWEGGGGGVRVMEEEVALVLREAMIGVVEEGTARRIRGVFRGPDGLPLVVGGKTGTGDNRYRTFAPGGRLIESRSVNRTSTFVFFLGERHYGVVTAYVPGEEADDFWFTSALPSQILRELAPVLEPVLAGRDGRSDLP